MCAAALKERTSCILAGGQTEAQASSQVHVVLPIDKWHFAHKGVTQITSCSLQVKNKFILALCFSFLFMLVEVVGGYFANRSVPPDFCIGKGGTPQQYSHQIRLLCSLAIMTDAAHLLSDVGGFAVAIFAAQYASKRSQQSHTFG